MITLNSEPTGRHAGGEPYWAFRSSSTGEIVGIAYRSFEAALEAFDEILGEMYELIGIHDRSMEDSQATAQDRQDACCESKDVA